METGRTVEKNVPVTAQTYPQQIVKPDEMIHMGMRYKDMADLEQLPRIQAVEVTQIEKEGRPPILEFDIYSRVTEGIINKMGTEHSSHLPGEKTLRLGPIKAYVLSISCFFVQIQLDFLHNMGHKSAAYAGGKPKFIFSYQQPHNHTGECHTLKGTIKINRELCKECHLCIYACKKGNLAPSKEYNSRGYRPVVFNEEKGCTGCTLCAIICPEIAIEVYRE
jgi:2-oxoglutarate ferredoxin oxidoreductase subunit delta